MSKEKLKLIVPICMLVGIFAIWYMHKSQESTQIDLTNAHNNPFNLASSAIDLTSLKNLNVPIIIDFGADSCIPCKEMAPVLVKLNEEMQNKAIIKFVDVWKNPNGADGFPVQVIPTQIIFHADGSPYVPKEVNDLKFIKYSTKEDGKHTFTAHQGGLTEEQMRRILKDLGTQ